MVFPLPLGPTNKATMPFDGRGRLGSFVRDKVFRASCEICCRVSLDINTSTDDFVFIGMEEQE